MSKNLIRGPITVGDWMEGDEGGTYPVSFRVALTDRAASLFHEAAADIICELIPTGDAGPETDPGDESSTVVTFHAPASFFAKKDPRWLRAALERAANQARSQADEEEQDERAAIERWLAGFILAGDEEA